MTDGGWKRIFVADDGTLRSGWKLLLFAGLFMILLGFGRVLLHLLPTETSPLLAQGLAMLIAALGAGTILIVGVDDRAPGALGFAWTHQAPREIGSGFLIGTLSLALVIGAMTAFGWIHYTTIEGSLGALLAVLSGDLAILAVAAAAEEALFRGYPFQVLVQKIGPIAATISMSMAFALAHGANPGIGLFALANIFLAGIMLSVAYLRTRSLWFATAVHLGWNWATTSALDLPVSGLAFSDTPLYDAIITGPDWATGGNFGPEGGAGGTVAIAVAPGLGIAKEMRERRPLADARSAG